MKKILFLALALIIMPASAMADYWVTASCATTAPVRLDMNVLWASGDTKVVSEEVIGYYNQHSSCFTVTETTATGVELNYLDSANVRDRVEIYDDFTYQTLATTGAGRGDWVVSAGTDGDATAGVVVANIPEGQIVMGSGGAGAAEDGSVMSLINIAQGSLVSLGMTVFEARVSFDQITGTSWNFGLSDVVAQAAERSMFTVNSGVVADGGLTITNAVAFAFSTDATATTTWQFCNEVGGVINAVEAAHTSGPVADTYTVLRIEVDANGTARWYVDGTLVKTKLLTVATTSLLIPFIGGNSADDADVPTDVTVDYIYFNHVRPASDA